MGAFWPLTGRSEELQAVEAALLDPDAAGVVVCGAAGVGKSRLARDVLSVTVSQGCETRWAVGTSAGRELPLGAFSAWLDSAGADSAQLVQLVRGVIESLTATAPGAAVVVGVDDVHLLDDLSAFVVQQIVARHAAKVVLTRRAGEPVSPAVEEIWKAGFFHRLDLQPLSREDSTALLAAALGGPVDPVAVGRLWKLTRGNVLYLRNIVEQELGDGRLAQQHGSWRWSGEPVVAPGLVEIVDSRMGALPASVSEVVDVLAVGEPLELVALRRITDAAAIEEAELRGLITLEPVDVGVEVRLAHPLYGEVRRNRAPLTRLQRLRGLVATEVGTSTQRDDMRIVVRRAALSLDSDLEPDPDLFIRAAQGATWLGDLPLADRLADAAIRAGGGAEASIVRACVLIWLTRGHEADDVLAAIDANELTDADRARLIAVRAGNMRWALADAAGGKKLLDEASQTIPEDSRSCLNASLAVHWAAMGKPELALRAARNLVIEQLPGIVGAEFSWAITLASGDVGRTHDAVAAAQAGYVVASRFFDAAQMRFGIGDAHVTALVLAGRIDDALSVAQELRQQATDLPGDAALLGSGLAGRSAVAAGRLDSACSLLGPIVEMLYAPGEEGGVFDFWYDCQILRTTALAMRGLTHDAAMASATLDETAFTTWNYVVDYQRGLAQAWVAAAHGAITEAISRAVSAAEKARAKRRFAAEVLCLQTATQFGERSCASRLGDLRSIVEGPRVGLATRFAAALDDGDAAELAAVSEDFERMGDRVAAVDAAAHAAVAYRGQDLRGSGLRCSTRAEALAEHCGGAITPALREATQRLPLTSREREIVMLLGQGSSTREVAQRLTLSVRTVESHLYRAMAKTGTASRDELAALLLPRRNSQPECRR